MADLDICFRIIILRCWFLQCMNYQRQLCNKKYHPWYNRRNKVWRPQIKNTFWYVRRWQSAVVIEPSRSFENLHALLWTYLCHTRLFQISRPKCTKEMGYYSKIEYKPIDDVLVSLNRNRFMRVIQHVSNLKGIFQGECN